MIGGMPTVTNMKSSKMNRHMNQQRRLAICLLLAGTIIATNASAMELELTGGYTFLSYRGIHNAGVVNANLITNTGSLLPTEWTVGYIFGQHKNPDNRWNNDDPTTYVGVGKRLKWHRLFLGFGIMARSHYIQRLSATLNFKTQIGIQYGYFVAMVQHMSNGGLAKSTNLGITCYSFGLRYGLKE